MKHKVIYRPVEKLIPYARNSRTHSDEQIAEIASSIKEFGFTNPILIDGEDGIIAGHGRVRGAVLAGLKKVPCIALTHLSETQRRAYIIADNKMALNAGWDDELLSMELSELQALDFDLTLTGFSGKELDQLVGLKITGAAGEDDAPKAPKNPVTQLGDLWVLGAHRLLCGDATAESDVSVLLGKERPDMIFTDTPYGMNFQTNRATVKGAKVKGHGKILGDEMEGEEFLTMIAGSLGAAKHSAKKGAAIYCCLTWRTYAQFVEAVSRVDLVPKSCIVWDKKSIGLGFANYRPQHEFIFYAPGSAWYGDKSQSDVWHLARDGLTTYVHPTQKPVELVERALMNSSKTGDVILDSFGGSGSTVIACQKLEREARVMELAPEYCDVIVKRWENFTGEKATLAESGQTMAQAKKRKKPVAKKAKKPRAKKKKQASKAA